MPVSHGEVFGAVKRIASRAGVPLPVRGPNKKRRALDFLRFFYPFIEPNRIDAIDGAGIGLK
ncbi:hypothetical protein LGM63_03645 [Burkholderia cepacia]|nr:hypothetical protein [Burkholderia cepacia]